MSTTQINLLSFTELKDTTSRVIADSYMMLQDLNTVKSLFQPTQQVSGAQLTRAAISLASRALSAMPRSSG